MKQVRFTRLVISPTYGNCDAGDVIRCSDAFARHVVDDLKAAEYVQARLTTKPKAEPELVTKAPPTPTERANAAPRTHTTDRRAHRAK